ncbi:hypothetical protein KAJ89_01810 [Candidatus Parcubacteria bacterium]|nr:hypothetical protein [Candidatus Parcubacteria bacterium]
MKIKTKLRKGARPQQMRLFVDFDRKTALEIQSRIRRKLIDLYRYVRESKKEIHALLRELSSLVKDCQHEFFKDQETKALLHGNIGISKPRAEVVRWGSDNCIVASLKKLGREDLVLVSLEIGPLDKSKELLERLKLNFNFKQLTEVPDMACIERNIGLARRLNGIKVINQEKVVFASTYIRRIKIGMESGVLKDRIKDFFRAL